MPQAHCIEKKAPFSRGLKFLIQLGAFIQVYACLMSVRIEHLQEDIVIAGRHIHDLKTHII